ncbi:hypothetical protein [Rubinisphaera italica]|uniref:DUF2262 domain-containing protein n=1 Tax=Rubinisphaera italica TaxID=2527969 RepID=A0A5C5XKH2_9PLAN|nr:hypothetical protein [Rubinisphaera italica]TWT62635.1 hypothetical protein Pan54_33790 [Rubinisphaera italica]
MNNPTVNKIYLNTPDTLSSHAFGVLTRKLSELEFSDYQLYSLSYNADVSNSSGEKTCISLVWETEHANTRFKASTLDGVLNTAERVYQNIQEFETIDFLERYFVDVEELAARNGFDSEECDEEEIYQGWVLNRAIFFEKFFRLCYFGNHLFSYDLILEIDYSWNLTGIQFDG